MPQSQQPLEGQEIILSEIAKASSHYVVDVGIGDGKWGKLLREDDRCIVGIEIWPNCVTKDVKALYDSIVIASFINVEKCLPGFSWNNFDVIILGDVLEHVERGDAMRFVERLHDCSARVFLTVPISPCPQDGTVYGNPYETHRDQWTHEELVALDFNLLHRGFNSARTVEIGTYLYDNFYKKGK